MVFVTQVPSRRTDGQWAPIVDIAPAKSFGELRVLFSPGMNFALVDDAVMGTLNKLVEDFDPKRDYLLALGDPLLVMAAAATLGAKHAAFSMLKWDRKDEQYFGYDVRRPNIIRTEGESLRCIRGILADNTLTAEQKVEDVEALIHQGGAA